MFVTSPRKRTLSSFVRSRNVVTRAAIDVSRSRFFAPVRKRSDVRHRFTVLKRRRLSSSIDSTITRSHSIPFCDVQWCAWRGMAWHGMPCHSLRRQTSPGTALALCASSVRLAFDRKENREKNESGRAFLRDDSPSQLFSPRERQFFARNETFDRYRSAILTRKRVPCLKTETVQTSDKTRSLCFFDNRDSKGRTRCYRFLPGAISLAH